jgi:purine-binding chemotaxis protein CheW
MSNELTTVEATKTLDHSSSLSGSEAMTNDYVTMTIADQLFGIPVLSVHDVLGPQKITRVPLAPPEVAGVLNLRGRIVTAINIRQRLGLPDSDKQSGMSVAVEYNGESYSLLIDKVGEVLSVSPSAYESNPATLDPRWREVSTGVYRLDGGLLVILDVERLLSIGAEAAAA